MSKWILTDDATNQHVMKPFPNRDIYWVIDSVAQGDDRFSVVIGSVTFDPLYGCNVHSRSFAAYYLHPYGYDSFDVLQEEYGDSALQIAAECVFETQLAYSCPEIFKGTLEECISFIDAYVEKENASCDL